MKDKKKKGLRKTIGFWFVGFMATVLIGLTGCSDGGGSSDSGSGGSSDNGDGPNLTTTISGTAYDDPISGATISLFNANGDRLLASGTSNADGTFTITVESDKIQAGFKLKATGGSIGGENFTEELWALYYPGTDGQNANITFLTTILHFLAQRIGGGNILADQTAVIDQLTTMGLINGSDWHLLSPASVDLEQLRLQIQNTGLAIYLEQLNADLEDGELSLK